MSDDGDLPPAARAVSLEGIDVERLLRERRTQSPALDRHARVVQVLHDRRDGLISAYEARVRLHAIAPEHYPDPDPRD